MYGADMEIINKCLEGDDSAFEELVSRYKGIVFNTSYRMLGSYEEAEDASQEVFIKMYRYLRRYDPQYKFSTWAIKITTNYCLDLLRKRKGETVPIETQYDLKDEGFTPEEEYVRHEKQQMVKKAVDSLPPKYKELIVLFHNRGLSYSEIMEVTGESLTIVKNRLYRARQMLKDLLKDMDKEGEGLWNAVK
ncbi:RNA polymerase sigma factor [Lutispora thermophila]|uniref:RNA polymerase sigma-70 factor, ECF subfamily n=1 Tax=Lutispora thermophila DSM 19022 TaxID=1122184 RepID=A0A1M6ATG4_9FIRM|nr:sigma-70 family RNA polymerase sigma factor [Lutispora thermophila]SHI39760.1 RNA polymerase sigma-70 factor, ECF subfamily [Lutispora thermophila DSM 19022]